MPAPTDKLARVLDATDVVVAGIQNEQWSSPTPCPEWSVRQLLNHLVSGNQTFTRILHGEELPPLEERRRRQAVDQLGDDPLAVYRAAGAELLSAFSQPGVFDGFFEAPVGRVPGVVLLHLRITELLIHGWDLARATGQPARLPSDLAEEELAFAQGQSAPNVPRTGNPFGPIQPVADDAPAIDRLVAYFGRPVDTGFAPEHNA